MGTMTQDWLADLFAEVPEATIVTTTPATKISATTPAKTVMNCYRCGGSGRIPCFSHVKAGECFACHGSGRKGCSK